MPETVWEPIKAAIGIGFCKKYSTSALQKTVLEFILGAASPLKAALAPFRKIDAFEKKRFSHLALSTLFRSLNTHLTLICGFKYITYFAKNRTFS